MLALDAEEEPLIASSPGQESSSGSWKPKKEPATPELEQQQVPNPGRFGLPTPDTTPEFRRSATGGRSRQVLAHSHATRDAGLVTPSISSRAPSIEELGDSTDRHSQHSHYNEGSRESLQRLSDLPSAPAPAPASASSIPVSHIVEQGREQQQEEEHSLSSVVRSVFNSVASFLNLAKQRKSRADDARVQSTIALIKSIPAIRRTREGNLTRKLTAKQYGQLLRAVEDQDESFRADFKDKIRLEYTRHTQRLEIRMPTTVHEEVGDFIMGELTGWRLGLQKSADARVADAARTIKTSGSADVKFRFPKGESDLRSPDRSVRHKECGRRCKKPTVLMEFAWTQDQDDLRDKAEAYSELVVSRNMPLWRPDGELVLVMTDLCVAVCRSQGEIRTVVAVDMRNMYKAETKNEKRLFQMYMKGGVGQDGQYSYPDDKENVTGDASFLVWRARVSRNGRVSALCVQNEKFRDQAGNAIESVSLRLPLQDFICKDLVDSPAGKFDAPPLEISSEEINDCIRETLRYYRLERDEVQKWRAEKEKEKLLLADAEKKSRRAREPRTTATTHEDTGRTSQNQGILGRIKVQGRLVSARFGS